MGMGYGWKLKTWVTTDVSHFINSLNYPIIGVQNFDPYHTYPILSISNDPFMAWSWQVTAEGSSDTAFLSWGGVFLGGYSTAPFDPERSNRSLYEAQHLEMIIDDSILDWIYMNRI